MWRAFAIAAVVAGGCAESGQSPDPATQQGRCTLLEGKNFKSRSLQECGLGPEGPGMCFWRISFAASAPDRSEFQWLHSDTGEFGQVICNGADLVTPIGGGPQTQPRGRLDGPTRILTWENVNYAEDTGGGDDPPPPDPKDPPILVDAPPF